ncbi:hypothetical protein E3N88_33441 [Mikania micrantha]|uniref:Uncharacterized protein n=1 Tax=Mikania micrantha TaxID=192012 RepID=A0A5N6MBH9_9ASTR|nr:hypothetical protein E3N88_33441 [Mikania micrantha]
MIASGYCIQLLCVALVEHFRVKSDFKEPMTPTFNISFLQNLTFGAKYHQLISPQGYTKYGVGSKVTWELFATFGRKKELRSIACDFVVVYEYLMYRYGISGKIKKPESNNRGAYSLTGFVFGFICKVGKLETLPEKPET